MTQLDVAPKLGRKRDLTRDAEILDATLEVLAETGYDGLTIDAVAARAKAGKATVYRRWDSKADLVIDAVGCMKNTGLAEDELPDTGTLRGDLVAMIRPHSIADAKKKLLVMAGVVSMMSKHPELTDAMHEVLVAPRQRANRILLERAIARGEIRADVDIETVSLVSAAMASYRTLMLRKPVDRAYLLSVIDGVILPAVGLTPA
jgi:AcrR family transcriptional regulator